MHLNEKKSIEAMNTVNENLGFLGIIKESLKILFRTPSIALLAFFVSFPLFCFLLYLELFIQQIITETHKYMPEVYESLYEAMPFGTFYFIGWSPSAIYSISRLFHYTTLSFFVSCLLYLGIFHVLDVVNAVPIVHSTSMIYAEEDTPANMKEILWRTYKKACFKGPLITSFYVFVLGLLIYTGLASLATQVVTSDAFLSVPSGFAFVALLIKYTEWTAIWNMGMVISILEAKHGDVALGVSAYMSRGTRKYGLFLTVLIFVSWIVLRSLTWFLYGFWVKKGGVLVLFGIFQVFLVCIGNVMKWVVFVVYFHVCKTKFLVKKVDVELGGPLKTISLPGSNM